MSEADDNLVLRLLREIRAKLDGHDARFDRFEERFERIERRIDDTKESVGLALGFAVQSNALYETTGERLDRMKDGPESLKARIAALEARP